MKIFSASNPVEAHIVCELLKSQRIEAKVHDELTFGLRGEIPLGQDTDPYVWVINDVDQARARKLIEEYEQQQGGDNWFCPQCAESIENQFALCWNCGEANPAQD